MSNKHLTLSEFNIEGQFLGFISDITGKFKYLQLASASGDVKIKIPKELRLSLSLSLEPGEQIRVLGVSKLDSHTDTIKFKAYKVTPIGFCLNQKMSPQQQTLVDPKTIANLSTRLSSSVVGSDRWETPAQKYSPKAKIIVCQKSGCLKRGGRGLLSELEKILRDRGLQDQVIIEYSSGCLKCCKSAPNYILKIGNKEYKNIHPQAIASLLENH